MKRKIIKWIRPVFFAAGGMLAGYLYYRFVGCSTGTCAITSNPANSMLYMGLAGLLLSVVFEKKEAEKESTDDKENL